MHIKVKRGLDIPIIGAPRKYLGELSSPAKVAVDFTPFDSHRIALKVKIGDMVKAGQAVAEDKESPGRFFVAPLGGRLVEIERGPKRALERLVIECDPHVGERFFQRLGPSRDDLIALLNEAGIFAMIQSRPAGTLANPKRLPKSIFVQAACSRPFDPPFELEIDDEPELFQSGLTALSNIAPVHLVYRSDTASNALKMARDVERHTVEGPHPSGDPTVHIYHIDPITHAEERVWTLTASTAIAIGRLVNEGRVTQTQIIALAGEGIPVDKRGYYRVYKGHSLDEIFPQNIESTCRLIAGNPLIGRASKRTSYLGLFDRCACALPIDHKRESLHFFKLGLTKYTATRAYLSGLFRSKRPFSFTTSQHGEKRAIIDGAIYDRVMSLRIPVAPLVKALLAKDYDLALELGLLEVVAEDFALSEFICPSKTPLMEIVRDGLNDFAMNLMSD